MKRWHWRALGIAAVVWLVVTLVRAAVGGPGHMGVGGVIIAAVVTAGLMAVAVTMFRYLWLMVSVIWQERWDWLLRLLGRRTGQPAAGERTWHSNVDGIAQFIMLVIMEAGIYWFTFLSGYGILLGVWVLGSLAWYGDVALRVVEIG